MRLGLLSFPSFQRLDIIIIFFFFFFLFFLFFFFFFPIKAFWHLSKHTGLVISRQPPLPPPPPPFFPFLSSPKRGGGLNFLRGGGGGGGERAGANKGSYLQKLFSLSTPPFLRIFDYKIRFIIAGYLSQMNQGKFFIYIIFSFTQAGPPRAPPRRISKFLFAKVGSGRRWSMCWLGMLTTSR